jgi:hypothetical protein
MQRAGKRRILGRGKYLPTAPMRTGAGSQRSARRPKPRWPKTTSFISTFHRVLAGEPHDASARTGGWRSPQRLRLLHATGKWTRRSDSQADRPCHAGRRSYGRRTDSGSRNADRERRRTRTTTSLASDTLDTPLADPTFSTNLYFTEGESWKEKDPDRTTAGGVRRLFGGGPRSPPRSAR